MADKWSVAGLVTGLHSMRCPECYAECVWCSWYRMNARETGCGCRDRKGKRLRCEKGEAERGKSCSTCDGSGWVQVKTEIVGKGRV